MSAGDGVSPRDRLRYRLVEHTTVLLAVCLLLVLGGAFVAYQAHAGPDTRTDERVAGTWTTNATFDHAAVVRRPSLAFREGTVLQNRSVYFRRVTPVLNGSFDVGHAGDPSDVATRTDLRLVVRSVQSGDGGERVLWSVTEHLDTVESSAAGPGRSRPVRYAVNVSERVETARRVRQDLGSTLGDVQILLIAETRAEATVAGERVTQVRRDRLRIRSSSGYYRVEPATGGSRTETITETVSVPVETDPVRAYGSLLVALVALVAGAGLWWLERNGRLEVSSATRAAIRRTRERDSFEEWISTGRIPAAADGERVIEVDSLEDLVDVAIDSDRRVIEDPAGGEYVVFDGSTRYRFQPGDGAATPTVAPETADVGRAESTPPREGAAGDGHDPTSATDGTDPADGESGNR